MADDAAERGSADSGGGAGLEICEDRPFQARSWRIQRVGWVAFALLLLAALAGLFGRGPFSQARLQAADGSLRVDYERFARLLTPTVIEVTLPAGAAAIAIDRSYADAVTIDGNLPGRLEAGAEQVVLRLAAPAATPLTIAIGITPQRSGRLGGGIRGEPGGETLRLDQLVYP